LVISAQLAFVLLQFGVWTVILKKGLVPVVEAVMICSFVCCSLHTFTPCRRNHFITNYNLIILSRNIPSGKFLGIELGAMCFGTFLIYYGFAVLFFIFLW
jgi:hypothetical protein